ncbi:MAG: galactose mutarotase [Neomegalonema sp.]|nr:galactose mutarotase [Neomegalonema sp.]
MTGVIEEFGRTPQGAAGIITLENKAGAMIRVSNWGARLVSVLVPDRDGRLADVTLGYDRVEDYVAADPFFGATCGRVANRLAQGRFVLDGVLRQVTVNRGGHCLHGGDIGFDKFLWSTAFDAESVTFARVSPDGEEGFPGEVAASVRYVFNDANELKIEMEATTSAPTLVNLANHAYWNLAGHAAGSVLDHELQVHADFYTPGGEDPTPTGEVRPVDGLAVDFRAAKRVRRDMGAYIDPERGYDCNFVVRGEAGALRPAARLRDVASGRGFELLTNQPGVQVYVGGNLSEKYVGKGGAPYVRHGGLCLETQGFPNAANFSHFPSVRLDPGQTYRHEMLFKFFAE